MVLINDEFFQIYELDSENTIIRRIAAKYKTLPKYLYFTNGKPTIENYKDIDNISIENILGLIESSKKFNSLYNYVMSISQGGKSEIEKLPNITPKELLITWFAWGKNIKNRDKFKLDIISNKKFENISSALEKIDIDIERERLETDILYNEKLVENDLSKFENLESTDGVERTKFNIENISMKVTIDIDNKSVLDIFDDVILTDVVPVATCDKFTKIIKDFTPSTSEWDSDRIEDIIILKVNSKISNSERDFTNVYIGRENTDIKVKIVIKTVHGNVSEKIFIKRILKTIGDPSIRNKIIDNVEGVFFLFNQSLNIYIFAELIMNNPLFSSLLVIDEHDKATKERNDIFTIFNHPVFGSIHAYITPKTAIHGDPILKRRDIQLGDNYIRIKITKSINKEAVKSYMNIMSKLFAKYNELEETVKDNYRRFIPDFADEEIKEEIKEEITLEKLNPDLFVAGYRRKCDTKHIVSIVPEDQVEELKRQKVPLLLFPKAPEEGPQFWYRCNNEKFKYPGLKFRKDLKTEYPVYPCCFSNDPSLSKNIRSAYNNYFNPEKVSEDTVKGVRLLTSKKRMMQYDVLAKLPDDVNKFFTSIEPGWEYVRSGIDITPSSFLECIMRSRESLSENEISRLEIVNTARNELNMFALCRQEAYDKTVEDIENIVKEESDYLDPKVYIRLLEETYGYNIFLFERTEDKSEMIVPRHVQSYYRIPRKAPSVCILIHKGSETDVSPNPQCELIVRYKDGKDIEYIYEYGSFISNELSDSFNRISRSYALETRVNEVIFPWSNDVEIVSQSIDSYGKTRILNVVFDTDKECSLITTPLPSFNVPEIDITFTKTSIRNAMSIVKILNIQDVKQYVLNEIVTSIIGTIGNIDIIIPVRDANPLKDVQIVRESISLPNNDISMFNTYNTNNKLARYITEYILWLFSCFVNNNKKLDYEDLLTRFIDTEIIIDNKFVYKLASNTFIKDDKNGVTKNGKLVVLSEEMEKRLIYVLRLNLKFNKKKITDYHSNQVIENFYKNVTDFKQYPIQNIFEGNNTIEKWISEKNKKYNLTKTVLTVDGPYFFKNNIISPYIFIAQNLDSWENALGTATVWRNKKINIGSSAPKEIDLSFTLYQYISSSEINKIEIEGDENPYNIKIIGWKNSIEKRVLKKGLDPVDNEDENNDIRFKTVIEEKDVFTVLLPIN